MMMDERPQTQTDDDADPTEAGTKSMEGGEPAGTTQRSSGSGDTRRAIDGSGDTR